MTDFEFSMGGTNLDQVTEDLAGHLLGLEKQVETAINRAIRKLGAWLRTHSVREIGKQLGIKQKVIRNRYRLSQATENGHRVLKIWVGLLEIAAHEAGNVSQNKQGAKVAGRQFNSAFKKSIFWSGEQIYIRAKANLRHNHSVLSDSGKRSQQRDAELAKTGGGRFPVQVVAIDISDIGLDVLQRYESRLNSRYRELLTQELNYVLNVET
ncbi:phage tail protein [Oceanospirillum sediminis]|uniref:Phage tail protein n=1 Tax=Oceanospirillum sediminis TaxID=2760088 RepID=A0A839IYD4_9GAMM|nr:phage tail protein [Oceanospirillum sediminis]MBB1489387.1 phage tail protein [Oceanospirillum sediminis]